MTKNMYLLEIGLEEVPAKYVQQASQQLENLVEDYLQENRLAYETVTVYASPRRFAIEINGVADQQEDLTEVAKGPAKRIAVDENGEWTKAAQGFARGKGMSVDDIYFEEVKGEPYVHLKVETPGKSAEKVLVNLHQVISKMHFPVSMHWGDSDFKFIRPIHWFVSLFNNDVLEFTFLGITAGRMTRGHRYLGKQAIELATASEYVDALRDEYVLVDQTERKNVIKDQIETLASSNNYQIAIDNELLEEVTQIVEYPTAFIGDFDEKYLELPDEVLITSMKNHQRYFYVKDTNNQLVAKFVAVRNGNDRQLDNVRRGNQKVLTARLEDGLFFVNEDKKHSIDEYAKRLENVKFHAEIGTMAEKMQRVGEIATILYQKWQEISPMNGLSKADDKIKRTAEIYKFDLVTGIVDEFSELQGIMGEKYAVAAGENQDVAQAIREHYLPVGQDSELPTSSLGILFAVADKLDTIISFFNIGRVPSGSNDPFALRRQMIGIVAIIKDYQLPFDWQDDLTMILDTVYNQGNNPSLIADLQQFLNDRLKQVLQNNHFPYDVIDAVLNANNHDVNHTINSAEALNEMSQQAHFKESVEAWNRVLNLGKKADELGVANIQVDENMLSSTSEQTLYRAITELNLNGQPAHDLEELVQLATPIAKFFDENMVFTDDEMMRNNRLAMLNQIAQSVLTIADTNKLQIK